MKAFTLFLLIVCIVILVSVSQTPVKGASAKQDSAARSVKSKRPTNMYAKPAFAKPLSPEEEEFAKAFADELGHAVAMVAANPDMSFHAQSLAGRVQKDYLRRDARERAVMKGRAQALLSRGTADRRRYFGAFADAGADRYRRTNSGLDTEMRNKLRRAVNARLDAQRDKIEEMMKLMTTDTGRNLVINKTWLVAGSFGAEVETPPLREITINEPYFLDFRWKTTEEGADRVFWQLLRPASSGQSEVILAAGISNGMKGDDDVSGLFSIDLRKYLSPVPPEKPSIYHVRVLPQRKAEIMIMGRKSSHDARYKPRVGGTPDAPKGVGPWSNPVVITYVKSTGNQTFFADVYRRMDFYLDSITMVEDQFGPGNEEFHLAGFVQENFPSSSKQSGRQVKFGPYFAELEPKVGDSHKFFRKEAQFNLNHPDQPEWPRSYTCVITIMEEDDGGSLAKWESDIWNIARDVLDDEVSIMVGDYLEDYRDELIKRGISTAVDMASIIGTAASAASASIVGAIAVIVTEVIVWIVTELPDDFYGVEAYSLVLPFNFSDYIEGLPFDEEGESFFSFFSNDGEFVINNKMQFHGLASSASAAHYDGTVDVIINWKFSGKEMWGRIRKMD